MSRLNLGGAILGGLLATAYAGSLHAQNALATPGTNDTAYGALRIMAKTLGKESLDRVLEVTGRDGVPEPYLWKIVLKDGAAGTSEVDVAAGKIAAQRTSPKPPSSGATIHFQELNLDSSGAFDATDAQARKVRLRFDSVNYVLRTSEASGKPQWTLDLFNQEGGQVGAMRLSANDGNVVSIDGKLANAPAPAPTTRPPAVVTNARSGESTTTTTRVIEPVAPSVRSTESHTTTTTTVIVPPPPPPPANTSDTVVVEDSPVDRGEGGLFTRTGRTLDKTTHTVGEQLDKTGHVVEHHLRRAGATVQRFFTGHSDLDEDAPPPPPPPRGPDYRGD